MENAQQPWYTLQTIELVNQARVQAGLVRLSEDDTLAEVAQAYSQAMATRGFYGHVDPQGRNVGDRIGAAGYLAQVSAENIARGQPSPAEVVTGWLNSPRHRANIMNGALRTIGAGYYFTPNDQYRHYWTHVFATPDPAVGRDRGAYVATALALLNRARQEKGRAALMAAPALEQIARNHLPQLVNDGAAGYRRQASSVLNGASRAALEKFARATALTAAGSATPEEVAAQWTQGGNPPALDGNLRAAGLAYHFAPQDEMRHYWLLVLGG